MRSVISPMLLALMVLVGVFAGGASRADGGLNPVEGVSIPMDDMGVRIFSKVPPVGVHPRVLMSPEDIGPWRNSVGLTGKGKAFFSKRYQSKLVDDLARVDASVDGQALCDQFKSLGGGNGGGNDVLYATLDAMYHPEDKQTAAKVCRAVANFARVVIARSQFDPRWGKYQENVGGIPGLNGIPVSLGEIDNRGGDCLCLSYDYLYNDMTKVQQDLCRRAIALGTKDVLSWGMGYPAGRCVSNFVSYHSVLALMFCSIEGEEGYDKARHQLFLTALQNWFDDCFYPGGGGNEDGYMANTGIREGTMAMIAWARRGHNLFRDPNYRAYWRWMVQSLVPSAEGSAGVPYACNSANPYESMPTLSRWAMPGDALANYYFSRYKGKDYQLHNQFQYGGMSMLFASDWEDTHATPLDIGKLGLPLTDYFPQLGLMTVRSDWSDQALSLNFYVRQDAWQNRHEGADRGRLVLCGLGRQWIGGNWNNNLGSETNSLVNIDGLAELPKDTEGAKVPNGNIIARFDSPLFVAGCMDLKRCYDWKWLNTFKNPGPGWEPETTTLADLGWIWPSPAVPPALYGADDPQNPKFGFVGLNYWRKRANPVQYAFRTCAMARGPHPYVILVDDIQKDGRPHDYTSNLEISADIQFTPAAGDAGYLSSLDTHTPVTGRMYLKVLSPPDAVISTEDYVLPGRVDAAVKHRRVVVSSHSVRPDFKFLFIPLREGETPPVIRYNHGADRAFVAWPGQEDTVTFTATAKNYTQIGFTRNGKALFRGFPSVKIHPSASPVSAANSKP